MANKKTPPRSLLHIGLDKTGTTAIQFYLSRNRAAIYNYSGVEYPIEYEQWGHHLELAQKFGFLAAGSRRKRQGDLLRRPISKHPFILSSEHFSYGISGKKVRELRDFLSSNPTYIFVYVRNLHLWVSSLYYESIKWQRYENFDTFFLKQLKRLDIVLFLKIWISHFGKNKVIVQSYDEHRLDVVSHFSTTAAAVLKVPNWDLSPDIVKVARENEALSDIDVGVLRLIQDFGQFREPFDARLGFERYSDFKRSASFPDFLRNRRPPPLRFTKEQLQIIAFHQHRLRTSGLIGEETARHFVGFEEVPAITQGRSLDTEIEEYVFELFRSWHATSLSA